MHKVVYRVGFWSALIAFLASVGYSVVQVLQVLRILVWPTDVILIYAFSFCIAWPFMLAVLALHYSTPAEKKLWSHAGLLFAVMYATYVTLMYAVQLGTAIPLALRGTPNVYLVVDRYSLFWTLDAMGYICMGLATLFAAPTFTPSEKWTRRFFFANGLFTAVIAFVYFYPVFSIPLLLLATPWIITSPGSLLLLAICFARRARTASEADSARW
jgi:hypothetical protein